MTVAEQLVLFLASFLANWFSALSGGGAGLIQFPHADFLGLPFGVALATWIFHKNGAISLTAFVGAGLPAINPLSSPSRTVRGQARSYR
ncbi:MAG: hypothetical protein ACYC2E_03190 [Sulfuricella sp.]